MAELQAKWYQENKPKIRKKYVERYNSDHLFRIRKNYSRRLSSPINKSKGTEKYLGQKISAVKKWFEFCFEDGYTFENYGNFWHIDHVIPVNSWNLNNELDLELCMSWYNLSPLEGSENISKHDSIIVKQVNRHIEMLKKFCKKEKITINNAYFEYVAKHLEAGNSLES